MKRQLTVAASLEYALLNWCQLARGLNDSLAVRMRSRCCALTSLKSVRITCDDRIQYLES